MERRDFLRRSLFVAGAALVGDLAPPVRAHPDPSTATSKVVIARDRMAQALDTAMQSFFDRDDPIEAWRQVVRPGEVVGLKVNCLAGKGLSTTPELVDVISERLQQAGVGKDHIVIWDRQNSDLEDAGFGIITSGSGVRAFGNDAIGFEPHLQTFGSAGSLLCRTLTRVCDAVINLPVLKDHGITGVSLALKNLFGAIHNPNKYHLNAGDPYVADVYAFPEIRRKVRLTICDATVAQYEGGPAFMPRWVWPFGGVIVGTDPVAIDHVGWGLIEAKRTEVGMTSLTEMGREPRYIATAADATHELGTNDTGRIEIVEI